MKDLKNAMQKHNKDLERNSKFRNIVLQKVIGRKVTQSIWAVEREHPKFGVSEFMLSKVT